LLTTEMLDRFTATHCVHNTRVHKSECNCAYQLGARQRTLPRCLARCASSKRRSAANAKNAHSR
jgi:hypothetical protein